MVHVCQPVLLKHDKFDRLGANSAVVLGKGVLSMVVLLEVARGTLAVAWEDRSVTGRASFAMT
jgi:hypothetical protein